MAKLEDLKAETFAGAYIECDFNASAVVRKLWPDVADAGGMGYSLLHSPGVEARIDELYREWERRAIKKTAVKLQRLIDLPTTEETAGKDGLGEILAKDAARVADVQAKYLGVASRLANADGSNLPIGPVICELPAQILDGSSPVAGSGGAPVQPGAVTGAYPEAEKVPPSGVPVAEEGPA